MSGFGRSGCTVFVLAQDLRSDTPVYCRVVTVRKESFQVQVTCECGPEAGCGRVGTLGENKVGLTVSHLRDVMRLCIYCAYSVHSASAASLPGPFSPSFSLSDDLIWRYER